MPEKIVFRNITNNTHNNLLLGGEWKKIRPIIINKNKAGTIIKPRGMAI